MFQPENYKCLALAVLIVVGLIANNQAHAEMPSVQHAQIADLSDISGSSSSF